MSGIAFLISNRYQIHHFAPIAAHLPDPTFVIERRNQDFGLSQEFVLRWVPNAEVLECRYEDLRELDGRFDLIVCHTPVLPNRLLTKTRVVAQQYSMAKEHYQYGLWRTLTAANLMYGPYSVERVAGFGTAHAVGNPILDPLFVASERRRPLPSAPNERRGLYAPTYGTLSSLTDVLPRLAGEPGSFTVKLHHAHDIASVPRLPPNCQLVESDQPVSALLRDADFVISDVSGSAFDAVFAGTPVVLADSPDRSGHSDLSRVERRGERLSAVTARWRRDNSLHEAIEVADDRLDREGDEFTAAHLSNPGCAAEAAAHAISSLMSQPVPHPAPQVRAEYAQQLSERYRLQTENRKLERDNDRLRSPMARTAHRHIVLPARAALQRFIWRSPRVGRVLMTTKHRLRPSAASRTGDPTA